MVNRNGLPGEPRLRFRIHQFPGDQTLARVFLYLLRYFIARISSSGRPYAFKIKNILSRCILSNAFQKIRKRITAGRLWDLTPSMSRLRAKFCYLIDLPGRNSFWLGLRYLSSAGWMRFSSMRLTYFEWLRLEICLCSALVISIIWRLVCLKGLHSKR